MVRAMPRPRRFPRIGAALAVTLTSAAIVAGPLPGGLDAPVAEAAPAEQFITAPGPLGPITVLGDSVLLGSLLYSPTLAEQLHQRGWGPVRMRAGEGYSTGAFNTNSTWKVSNWITTWRSQGWDPVDLVINLGANDSGLCGANVTCAYDAIMHLVNTIGPGHRIWWPKITRFFTYTDQQNAWNQALDQVAAERADFWTWDWPTEMLTGGYSSPDRTHLSADSYRKRSQVMSREITADLVQASHVGGDAPLPQAIGTPSTFVPLPPIRVGDTRIGGGPPVAGGSAVEIDMTPHVPSGTTAVAVNLTSDQAAGPGFLTGYPCDRPRSEVSNVNYAPGVARGALGVIPLSADGHLCVFSRATSHVIVDLQGAFVTGSSDGARLTPLEPPGRLLDTRQTGRSPILEITAPAGVTAVSINLTATNVTAPGWLKAYPCDGVPPEVSNVNYHPGDAVASAAFVPVSSDGTFCVQSLNPVDVVVDITGEFREGSGLRFVPTDPTRMLDTRSGIGGWAPIHGSGQTLDVGVVPPDALAVTGTITLVEPMRPGWLAAHPCGPAPSTSSVNGFPTTVFANAVTVGVDDGRLCVTALSATQTLFDVTGWWVA